MQGSSHILTGVASGLVLARMIQLPAGAVIPALTICGMAALAPDIDEPGSTISQHLPSVVAVSSGAAWITRSPTFAQRWEHSIEGMLLAGAGYLLGLAIPRVIKRMWSHRGITHHPFVAIALVVLAYLVAGIFDSVVPLFAAVGWSAHLIGDGMTKRGLPGPWHQRIWVLPHYLRFRTGTSGEAISVALWVGVVLLCVGPTYLRSLLW